VSKIYVATIKFLLYSAINNELLWTNVVTYVMLFTARQQDAIRAMVNPSITPSVCLSVTRWCYSLSKWLKLRSCGLHWRI